MTAQRHKRKTKQIHGVAHVWDESKRGWIDPEDHSGKNYGPGVVLRFKRKHSKHHKTKNLDNMAAKTYVCFYHLCRKRRRLYKCKYCGEYFCKEHLRACHPTTAFTREWHESGGHPCVPFQRHQEVETKRKEQEYRESLDRLIQSKPIQRYELGYEEEPPEPTVTGEEPIINYIKYIIGGLVILFAVYMLLNFSGKVSLFGTVLNCTDGTFYSHCSKDEPYYCLNGTLVKNSTVCGCPYDYRIKGDDCELIPRCSDRTVYGECSTDKPLYCLNGSFIKKASSCGCPLNEVAQEDNCISKYETGPKEQTFSYVVRGKSDNITFTVYSGLNDYLAGLSREYYCGPACPSDRELDLRFLDQNEQKRYLKDLVDIIKSKTSNSDEQARIAISLVQKIPYDWEGFRTNSSNDKYPYEVLYDKKGVCGEKSILLAFILRELGFDIVLGN